MIASGWAVEFLNCYEDQKRAEAYAKLEFSGTYYLAYRDLPAIFAEHVKGKDPNPLHWVYANLSRSSFRRETRSFPARLDE